MSGTFSRDAIVVTSINRPTACLIEFATTGAANDTHLIVVGDTKSPSDFQLERTTFVNVDDQKAAFPRFAALLPYNSYARKNIGYLWAIQNGAVHIIDTDDDNAPLPNFWRHRDRLAHGNLISRKGWVNAYTYFSDAQIWPRGLPLNEVQSLETAPARGRHGEFVCPIQQGLADDNPDVDAVYRLLLPLPIKFAQADDIILDVGAWCPFNSQNTHWWKEAFPLLYLPSYCSFRMTDIWRSFVAQRILWENDWRLSFHASTVYQDRNEHNLMRDFEQEVPGYLNNAKIVDTLMSLEILKGAENQGENLRTCYAALVRMGVIDSKEIPLLNAWIEEL